MTALIDATDSQMAMLADPVAGLQAAWSAQGAGRITAAHARFIVEAGAHLDDPVDRAAYAAAVLLVAEVESPNRLRRDARRIAEEYRSRSLRERHRDAREQRRVWVKDLDDGMSELGVHGPSTLIHGMYDRLSQMAHRVREEGAREAEEQQKEQQNQEADDRADERTVDQATATEHRAIRAHSTERTHRSGTGRTRRTGTRAVLRNRGMQDT